MAGSGMGQVGWGECEQGLADLNSTEDQEPRWELRCSRDISPGVVGTSSSGHVGLSLTPPHPVPSPSLKQRLKPRLIPLGRAALTLLVLTESPGVPGLRVVAKADPTGGTGTWSTGLELLGVLRTCSCLHKLCWKSL